MLCPGEAGRQSEDDAKRKRENFHGHNFRQTKCHAHFGCTAANGRPSLRANRSRDGAPDDRLREAIQKADTAVAAGLLRRCAPRNDEKHGPILLACIRVKLYGPLSRGVAKLVRGCSNGTACQSLWGRLDVLGPQPRAMDHGSRQLVGGRDQSGLNS
jgi:hypothetical protein